MIDVVSMFYDLLENAKSDIKAHSENDVMDVEYEEVESTIQTKEIEESND